MPTFSWQVTKWLMYISTKTQSSLLIMWSILSKSYIRRPIDCVRVKYEGLFQFTFSSLIYLDNCPCYHIYVLCHMKYASSLVVLCFVIYSAHNKSMYLIYPYTYGSLFWHNNHTDKWYLKHKTSWYVDVKLKMFNQPTFKLEEK